MEQPNTQKPEGEIIKVPEGMIFNPAIFDPNKEQLASIAAEVAKITADPTKITKEELALVSETKNKLVKARTRIQAIGKATREGAIKYQKDVIAYEKELIAIIEPEEQRLKEITDGAKAHALREARKESLPEYKAKLASIGDDFTISDEELLEFDPTQFQEYYNQRLGAHLEAQKQAAEAKAAEEAAARAAEQKKIDDEKAAIERDKEKLALEKYNTRVQRLLTLGFKQAGTMFHFGKEACEADVIVDDANVRNMDDEGFNALYAKVADDATQIRARWAKEDEEKRQADIKAAEEKAKQEAEEKHKKELAAQEEKRQADEAAAKKAEEEQKAKEESERKAKEANEVYQKWLVDSAYNPETDVLKVEGPVTILYRKISEYKPQ